MGFPVTVSNGLKKKKLMLLRSFRVLLFKQVTVTSYSSDVFCIDPVIFSSFYSQSRRLYGLTSKTEKMSMVENAKKLAAYTAVENHVQARTHTLLSIKKL